MGAQSKAAGPDFSEGVRLDSVPHEGSLFGRDRAILKDGLTLEQNIAAAAKQREPGAQADIQCGKTAVEASNGS